MDIRIWYLLIIQIILLIALYRITLQSIGRIYVFFRRLRFSDGLSKLLLSIIFLPGTFVHELSHFVCALVTMHRVTGFTILPVLGTKGVRMGSVSYYPKHPILSLVVGIAPFFGGYFATALIYLWIQQTSNPLIYLPLWYVLFTIQSTMFASESDLKEIIWMVPIALIVGLAMYIWGADPPALFAYTGTPVWSFFSAVVQVQLIGLCVHMGIIVMSRVGER